MTSKRSFLVDLKTNARRRVWLFVIMFLSFFFFGPVFVALSLSTESIYYTGNNLKGHLASIFAINIGISEGMGLLISLLAVISAIQGFSYMYQRKKLDMYMSVPVTKSSRFAAIYVNGLLAYLFSYLFNMLLSFFVAQAMGAGITKAFGEAGAAVIGNTVLYLAVYHIAILAVMLTGNLIVTLMGTAVLLFYDGIVYLLLGGYMETFFSSFYYKSMSGWNKFLISPIIRFFMLVENTFDFGRSYSYYRREIRWGNFAADAVPILVVAVVAFVLAYWCYTKKPAEICGKSIAFPKIKPVIKVCVTTLAGLSAGVIFYQFSGRSYVFFIFGMLAGTLLCHGIVEVIYDFDIRSVKKGWKSLIVSGAVVMAVFLVFLFDLFRYDLYVPDAGQVDNVSINFLGNYNRLYDENLASVSMEEYVFDKMKITDIEPVLELAHNRMGQSVPEDGTDVRYCIVQYTMKNGKKVYRQFLSAYREDTALLDRIMTDSAYQKGYYPVYNEPLMELGSRLNVYYDNGSGSALVSDMSVEKLKNAYRKDLETFTFTKMMEELVQGQLRLECIDKGMYVYTSMPVYPSFANTIALLEEAGLYSEQYIDIENAEQIIVSNANSEMYDVYSGEDEYGVSSYLDFRVEAAFDDAKEMQEIADSIYPVDFTEFWMPGDVLNTDYSVTVIFKNMKDKDREDRDEYSYTYYMLADQIPDFVKERTAYREDGVPDMSAP